MVAEPRHETEKRVNVLPMISLLVKMFVEYLPDIARIEKTGFSEGRGRTKVFDGIAHVVVQPDRDRHHESRLATMNDLTWQEAPDCTL